MFIFLKRGEDCTLFCTNLSHFNFQEYPFILDPFQREAILCIDNNESVLVSAHTSAGKTVCAEWVSILHVFLRLRKPFNWQSLDACLLHTGMPLHWHSERNREWFSPVPSRPSPTRNTGRCMRNSKTWAWWLVTSPSTPLPPALSWQQRWDIVFNERADCTFLPAWATQVFFLILS